MPGPCQILSHQHLLPKPRFLVDADSGLLLLVDVDALGVEDCGRYCCLLCSKLPLIAVDQKKVRA